MTPVADRRPRAARRGRSVGLGRGGRSFDRRRPTRRGSGRWHARSSCRCSPTTGDRRRPGSFGCRPAGSTGDRCAWCAGCGLRTSRLRCCLAGALHEGGYPDSNATQRQGGEGVQDLACQLPAGTRRSRRARRRAEQGQVETDPKEPPDPAQHQARPDDDKRKEEKPPCPSRIPERADHHQYADQDDRRSDKTQRAVRNEPARPCQVQVGVVGAQTNRRNLESGVERDRGGQEQQGRLEEGSRPCSSRFRDGPLALVTNRANVLTIPDGQLAAREGVAVGARNGVWGCRHHRATVLRNNNPIAGFSCR